MSVSRQPGQGTFVGPQFAGLDAGGEAGLAGGRCLSQALHDRQEPPVFEEREPPCAEVVEQRPERSGRTETCGARAQA